MKVLVAITSFGTANDRYLSQVIAEYRAMPFTVDVAVCSNQGKAVPENVELVVGLPTADPWSLPFAHKEILAKRVRDYDLFIYSEDDILITERNIRAFLEVTDILPSGEIPGFIRYEIRPDGKKNYPDFHANFRWEPKSVRVRGGHTLAFFTNEHAGCYLLTQGQLQHAIASGGFLVSPHRDVYDLACTAATDPYTQCGLQKLISLSHFGDFLVHHLPNKYAEEYGLEEEECKRYIRALLTAKASERVPWRLNTDSAIPGRIFSKNYYEPARRDLITLIPRECKTVLSVGCGWGATEACLRQTGRRVIVSALDPVMSRWAESRGVEVLTGNQVMARERLAGYGVDCLLLSNVLHLASDPAEVLSSIVQVLPRNSTVVAAVPSLHWIKVAWKKMRDSERCRFLGDFERTKMHLTSQRIVRGWFHQAGIRVERLEHEVPEHLQSMDRSTLGLLRPFLAREMLVVGRTTQGQPLAGAAESSAKLHSPVTA
ncbi:MAG: class I SAM-dependent methyltransferase [Candidatus Sulfotelmatobacter sp.]